MISLRRSFPVTLILAVALLVVACGGSTTSSNPAPTPTTAPTATPTIAPTTAPTTAPTAALIKTATATVSGASETILANAQGLTLYYRTSDSPPSTVCSGGCASAWPPLLAPGSGTPTSATPLPGKLTVVVDANGNQIEYNGHPLYTFSSDSAAGQTNGEGVGGVWHVATPNLS
jgi:predicted lipoprotein with Yx(FWY)xxD motif